MTSAEQWRWKAEETRTIAESYKHPAARRMLEQVARHYERLARLEARSRDGSAPP